MSKRKFIIGIESEEILEVVSAKHVPLTITVKQDNSWLVYKANFIAVSDNKLILTQPTPDVADSHMEPATDQELAVTFKKGYHKFLFTTQVIAQEQFEMDPGIFIPCLTVKLPEQIEKIQRRAYNRAKVPHKATIDVKLWRVDAPEETWHGELEDLSAGGLGIRAISDSITTIEEDEQFTLEFIPLEGQEPLSVTCRFRHAFEVEGCPDKSMMGFQILGLEVNESGLRTLRRISRIVAVFLRQDKMTRHAGLSRN